MASAFPPDRHGTSLREQQRQNILCNSNLPRKRRFTLLDEKRQTPLALVVIDRRPIRELCTARQRLGVAKEDAIEPPAVQLQTELQMPVLDQALLDDVEFLREQRRREALAPDVLLAGFDESKCKFAGFESAIGGDRSFENGAVA